MPAYTVRSEYDDEHCEVFFAARNIEARRWFADSWHDGELRGISCTRSPGFDRYEESGKIPIWAALEAGWWTECWNCGEKMSEDSYGIEGEPLCDAGLDIFDSVGFLNGRPFCSNHCAEQAAHRAIVESRIKGNLYNKMCANMESKFGCQGLTFTQDMHMFLRWSEGEPWVQEATIRFTTPGMEHGGFQYKLEQTDLKSEPVFTLTCAYGDQDVMIEFIRERTGKVIDRTEKFA